MRFFHVAFFGSEWKAHVSLVMYVCWILEIQYMKLMHLLLSGCKCQFSNCQLVIYVLFTGIHRNDENNGVT